MNNSAVSHTSAMVLYETGERGTALMPYETRNMHQQWDRMDQMNENEQ